MRLIGTVASKPTERIVPTGAKKDHPKRVREVGIVDEDGGLITLQAWQEPTESADPFGGLEIGSKVDFRITNPSTYRGATRAALAEAS